MENILVHLLSQITPVSAEEALAIENSFPIKTFEKGSFLLKEGQTARDSYLVVAGCVRKFSMLKDEEVTHDFFTEGDTVADFNSMGNQIPTKFNFVCTENSTLAIVNAQKETQLYQAFPRFEAICRVEFEKMMGEKAEKVELFANYTPEEKYQLLLKEKPELLNKVPQYQIASYLGIKPETLSRIRKRITLNA